MFYGRRTWIVTKIHAFEDVLPGISLCGKESRSEMVSLRENESTFKASPCQECMEKWKDIQTAEILSGGN